MGKSRTMRLLLIPLLLGLSATMAAYKYLDAQAAPPPPVTLVPVLVAKGPIAARTVVQPQMVVKKEVPEGFVKGAEVLANAKDVEGQVTTQPLADGEIILKSKLADKNKSSLSYRLSPGLRAITVRIDEVTGVAGYPEVGDMVDLVLNLPERRDPVPGDEKAVLVRPAEAYLLVQGVQIVGRGINDAADEALKKAATDKGKLPTSFTLAVTPQQAVFLTMAEGNGHIRLLLRPAVAEPIGDPNVLQPDQLRHFQPRLGGTAGAAPALPPTQQISQPTVKKP